ncbi:uncharacterized protein LOC117909087 [Vitis riparia]|uniref:uncharacterized protein LOC117909087 n=1 Tax=Vitis riparia TaxID=96939 RepID=UPI00155AC425|nr:uncharacterized protein LOC117909087 [Vitis riparia]
MATNSSSSTSDIIISLSSSSHQMETSHIPITAHKLNGQNYLQWSQSILMFIRGNEKDDYITGASAALETTTSTYKKWIVENNMVMSWLVNSMTTDIDENFLSFDTAKEIWDIAKETFSDKENTSEIIQIEGTLQDLRQGNLTVTEYFNTLTRLWRQLDTFEVHNWNCVTDGLLYKKIVEGKLVFKFLLGLNNNLDEIRGRIMGVKPLPSLREAFSEVRREESWKNLMMGSHQQLNMAESSALKTQFAPFDNRQKIKGGRPWCDHCRKPGHSRETCWKIHGKPVDWKPRQPLEKEGRGNHVATDEQSPQPEASPFNKEQMEMLQKLLSPLLSVQSQTGSSSNQVIGFGTLAHKVRIADGSLSKVAGTGSVVLSRDLTLNSDLDSGKTIGNADECSGLYILKEHHDLQERPQMAVGSNSFSPYYPKNDIQGENSTQEYQFWDLESFSESPITTENHIPPESFNQPESIVDLWDKEHIQEETEEGALSQQTHEAEPGPNPSKLPGNNAPDGTVDSELENDILNMPIAWRKEVRSCTQHPIGNFLSYDKLSPTFRAFTSSITEIQVPRNIQEAFKYPKWKAAVDEEVRELEKNGTWEITDLPRGKKPVGCKWIFTVKYKADGNVDRYKARLVAKGFTQSYGIDYQETFAPVAKLNTVRVLLSLAANLDWSLHQLDVKNAFLNGDLEEEVYMDIPAGLETTSNFNKEFEIKDLGNLKYFLRMEIARSKKGMLGCKPAETLMDTTVKLEESDGSVPVDKGRYQCLVGKLIYLSHTRPDIGFSVSVSVVAHSSAEAEFRAMAQGIYEGIWLNRLLEELRVPLKHPMVLYCDNQAAISIAKNLVHHDQTKHVEIDRHFIKEKIEEGVFKVSYTPTNCQTADILTKALARVNFEDLTEKLGMINIYNAA